MNESIAPVCYITDRNYVIPTAVSIKSLMDNYKNEAMLNIYIINTGIDDWQRELFYRYNDEHKCCKIQLLDINIDSLEKYKEKDYYVTPSGLVKFMLPRLLDKHDKLLYIDGDTIIQGDITQILKFDLSQYYAAVVADPAAMLHLGWQRRLNRMRYFNSGLLYINCIKFKNDNVEKKLFHCKESHPEYCCMDQDVFNDIFKDRVKYIDIIYNFMEYNIRLCNFSINIINHLFNSNYQSFDEIRSKALILHLTNEYKPWMYRDCYMADEWYKIFKQTPFGNIPLSRKSCYYDKKEIIKGKQMLSKEVGRYSKSFYIWGIKIIKLPRFREIMNKLFLDIKKITSEGITSDMLKSIDEQMKYIQKYVDKS